MADAAVPPSRQLSGPQARAAQQSHRGGVARLGRLVRRLEAVAEQLASPSTTGAARSVLQARYSDLQRRVNELDGIVAGEGYEVSGQDHLAKMGSGRPSPPEARRDEAAPAPARPEADRPRVDVLA